MLKVVFTNQGLDDLTRIDEKNKQRIIKAIERFADSRQGDVKKLKGKTDEWRLRVGDWRIRFTKDEEIKILSVLRVLPRGSAYRD